MRAVTAKQMRELDARTIRDCVSGEVLMERAGRGVARCVDEFCVARDGRRRDVLIVAGRVTTAGTVLLPPGYLLRTGSIRTLF